MGMAPKPLQPTLHPTFKSPLPNHISFVPLRPRGGAARRPGSVLSRRVAMAAQPNEDAVGGAPPPPPPLEVLVYCGEGAGYHSARNTLRALQRCLAPGVEARLVGTSELLEGTWRERCLLFVMPGGADLPYCKHLNGHGNRLLRGYVEAGGSYLGICAGAYYACDRVEFEPGSPLEVIGDRELRFFPGTARGAAYPGFDYLSERGAWAAPLRFRPLPPSAVIRGGDDGVGAPSPPPPPRLPPRLGRHHLNLHQGCDAGSGGGGAAAAAAAGVSPRSTEHDVVTQAAEEGRGERQVSAGSNGGGRATDRELTHGSVEPVVSDPGGADGAGGEYDGWLYCRDYSNGGPVFVLERDLAGDLIGSAAGAASGGRAGDGELNGGGVSKGGDVSYDAVQGDTEVLAVYPELDNAMAAVRCRVGDGVAVLCGTHPEMPHTSLTAAVQLYDDRQARHVAALGSELAAWEPQRRRLWAALLMACCTATAAATAAAAAVAAATATRSAEEECGRAGPGVQVEDTDVEAVIAAAASAAVRA
ncbi:biotin holocarboxylase synthetase [Pleodorina starrii]|uniref:Biotin holocarboxylase synthetase n=1 Tax=Pleodorina starrii TaxID=330485 RepID=A0A9W6BMC0_9CHLO|nr:biotin holocarboxylase synthetase [Pleodorina starrii]